MQQLAEIQDCEFCERKAKYIVKVMSIDYSNGGMVHSKESTAFRCAYHKNSSKRYYETEYNSFRPITELINGENNE